ncbi:ATP-binding protein [Paenibacillus residui]|uniref:histidine kinase n=1 Tax=Paenibacillus residui TaxID=629724 RepID=A0ABW3DFL2_9BACL
MRYFADACFLQHCFIFHSTTAEGSDLLLFFDRVCHSNDIGRRWLVWLPLNYEWTQKLQIIVYPGAAIFLFEFVSRLLSGKFVKRVLHWYSIVYVLFLLFILWAPPEYVEMAKTPRVVYLLFAFLAVPFLSLRSTLRGNKDALFLLLGTTALMANIIWDVFKKSDWLNVEYYPVDMILACLAFATYWFRRYFRTAAKTKQLAEKLQREDKLKDDFLANTSHELRNPLHAILNIAQAVLDSKASADDKTSKNMNLLMTIGRRMSLQLNDLLDLTRLKENRVRLNMTSLRVQTVVSGVLDMLRFMTEGKPVRFVHRIPDNFPPVMADENRLIQILFNLLHNAVKYTHEGTITIDASIKEGMARIRVEDTGIGMDEETQTRIFQPYEQGDSSITAIGGGIGLGLNICQQLVNLHGGTIEVQSVPGQGSVFTFTLPLAEPAIIQEEPGLPSVSQAESETAAACVEEPSRALSESSSRAAPGPAISRISSDVPRLLAVDDDPVNLNILEAILSSEPYEIVTAASAQEALAMLEAGEWDLIISDVMMPKMSGYELTRKVRERFSPWELPVLLVTARNQLEDIQTGFLAGANDYVTKPAEAAELKARVYALTGLKRSVHDRLRMEAAWLQAQIKPHFMFNTLNSLVALSYIDMPRMRTMLEAFGDYLRTSFDFQNSERLVPLEHELGLVRSYLAIEKERFEDRLQVSWEIDHNVAPVIPPLSIQPLVENAIRHGLMKRSEGGLLRIRITDMGDRVEISIEDNGVGIESERLRHILEPSSGRSGIGLSNTDRRLRQIYGQGLQIESIVGQGTIVSFIVTK